MFSPTQSVGMEKQSVYLKFNLISFDFEIYKLNLRVCCKYTETLYFFTYMPFAHVHLSVCTAQVHKTVERNFPRTYRRELPSTKLILYSFTEFDGKGSVLEQNSSRKTTDVRGGCRACQDIVFTESNQLCRS
jgi:hypothetical protein